MFIFKVFKKGQMKKIYYLFLLVCCLLFSNIQFVKSQTGCDLALIRQTFTNAGCTELAGCLSSCSMYFYNPLSQTGNDAQAWAQGFGANLISLQSAAENNCIVGELNAHSFGGIIWIGFNDIASEGSFVWYDQSPIVYTNWNSGEPNNSGNEDCVQIYPDGHWNDLNCSSGGSKSVIEVNLCPVTTITASASTVCAGTTVNLNASTYLGSSPYTYSWSSNSGGFVSTSAAPTATAMVTTIYSVTATDRFGCTSTASILITVNPAPIGTITGTVEACKGSPSPNVTFTGTTGTAPFTFTYKLNGGANQTISTTSGNSVTLPISTATIGTYQYTLVSVLDHNNCSKAQTDTATVTVNPLPTATLTGTATVCVSDASPSVVFTGAAGTAPYTFTYKVNGGTSQTATTTSGNSVTLTIPTTASGSFVYTLISVQDSTTCSQTQSGSATVTVNPLPTASISGTVSLCKNATAPNITFTGANGTAPYTFTYAINGITQPTVSTTSGNSINVLVPTSVVGTFVYTLVNVKDASASACSQAQTGSATIKINPLPTAIITGAATVCKNATAPNITFTGATGTAPYTFSYTINGGTNQTVTTTSGNSVTVSVPTVTAGTFIYALVSIQDSASCSQTQTGSVTVLVNPLPTASISGTTAVCASAASPNITFTGLTGIPPYTFTYAINSGTNQTISTIGNSNTATVPVFTSVAGSFIYTLVSVQDSTTCSQTQTGTATITVNPLPTATISGTASLCKGATAPIITFTGSNATAPYTFTYTLNNGANQTVSTTSGNSVTITVPTTTAGTFSYSLVSVTDASSTACSQTQSGTAVVTVNPNPVAGFQTADTVVCEPFCVQFQDLSTIATGTTTSLWNFGDGNTGTNPKHCYVDNSVFTPALFTVTLTVSSDSGCVSTITKNNYITVNDKPVANFTVQPSSAKITNPVISITDLSSGTNFWNWNFGDTTTSVLANPPSHTYADTGTYFITLITSTLHQCADTAQLTIIIEQDFTFYIPNAFSPNNDGINDTFAGKSLLFFRDYQMSIFDRWGNLIFFSNDINMPWDGKANHGTDIAQQDVYVYVITLVDLNKLKHNYRGIISLVR
jgi:gliding motility-associated-like protein